MTDTMVRQFRTSDMALATFLRLELYDVQEVKIDDTGTCYWYFDGVDSLHESCEAFREGIARVEPREYNRLFAVTKKERWALTDDYPKDPNRK